MHPNQIETSPALVRSLLKSQWPALVNEPIAPQPVGGTDNAVYRVGEHHSVRLPIIEWAVGNEARMRPWLPWLRDRLAIEVPVPLLYGKPDCGFPHEWTVYPWFEGETLDMGCDDPIVARDIAQFLSQLRSLPTEGAPAAGRSPHALDADVRKSLAQLEEDDHREDLIAIWNQMMTTPAWDGSETVWMHGDVAPGNLIFRNGRLVASIDWSGLGVGDPANDLQVAWNFLSASARQVLKAEMGIGDQTWHRARARAFAQAAFQLPYYRETFVPLANQAKHVFAEILREMA
jgi:aminoglycoside phosphotransferase (APT) family kinase protein